MPVCVFVCLFILKSQPGLRVKSIIFRSTFDEMLTVPGNLNNDFLRGVLEMLEAPAATVYWHECMSVFKLSIT